VQIRRIRADEWRELRELRLRALRDTPEAFGSTYAMEAAEPEQQWREWASDGAEGGASYWALAVDDDAGRIGGMAFGSRHWQVTDAIGVFSMWVDPALRGQGMGQRLVESVVAWARTTERPRVVLSVNETNEVAIRLYERCGFVPTGTQHPIRDGSSITAISMAVVL
jgi:RimJ/RimL family protein N-acetyltransferase